MKIVFAGSGEFGIPCLKALAASQHQLRCAIAQPDRPAGRRKTLTPPPLARVARELGIPLFQPERINRAEARQRIAELDPDLMIVVAYGQILRPKLLELPKQGCLNVHGSLLPRWRGASPISAGILAGDAESGVTIMQMDAGLDTGPILQAQATPIGAEETAGELHDRLALLAAPLLIDTLAKLEGDGLEAKPQDDASATLCGLISKEEGRLDWRESAKALHRRVRAMTPWPGAFGVIETQGGKSLRLIIEEVSPVDGEGAPGEVLRAEGAELIVASGNGALALRKLRPAGRASVDAAAFLRGYPLRPRDRFSLGDS